MRLTWATTAVALLLTSIPLAVADVFCDKSTTCEVGCCGTNNICGTGPDYCSKAKCINSCDYKAECNPGNWPSQYFNATKCPLNVCCSKFGFCGTTEEFCGKETVKRPSCDIGSQSVKRVIGYYGSGGASRSCNNMIPSSFPQGIYTHIYFAFGSIDPDSFKVIPAGASDVELYPQLAALKTRDMGQELWLSIGGWTFSDKGSPTATTFSDLVNADETRQRVFFASLILFMQTWGFSGVDIDWEYPVDHDRNGRESDFKAYPRFMKRLKAALRDYKYGLSVTLPTSYWYLQHFDLENLEPSVDWFNVMSYDLHGAWDIGNKWTGAFVGAHTNLTEIKTSLDLLWRNKVSPSKVVLGLAFYGRAVTLANPSCSEPGCAYLSAGDAGECSGEPGILFNSEITDLIRDKKLRPKLYKDAAVKTIQWNSDQWVSYDDKDTWKLKANFLKSQCLSGVLVWAVDYDDDKHSYSKGLAAALGIKINVDPNTGLTIKLPDKKVESTDFCYFTNCGQTCPRGYTEIIRDDDKSQIMLDATHCPDSSGQVQTLCCPKSSKVPVCRWRGRRESGHCVVGCNAGEAEVGTLHLGCKKSGWQSACCDVTESTEAWSKCKWTDLCFDDDTCPTGYSSLIAKSRDGWGGQRSCKSGKYNYCCDETPKSFKNCEWVGNSNTQLCTDSCPAGSTRIAEQSLTKIYGQRVAGDAKGCVYGNEAYCCAGDKESDKDERSTIIYRDSTAKEFDELLQKFLKDPVCLPQQQATLGVGEGIFARDLFQTRATDQGPVLADLVPIMVNWLTAEDPRHDMEDIYQMRVQQFGYGNRAANVSTFTDLMYQGDWSGRPLYSPTRVVTEALCDFGESREGMDNVAAATDALCDITSGTSSGSEKRQLLEPRRFYENSMVNRVGNEPTIAYALRGVNNGDLSLHYVRWLRSIPPNSAPGYVPTQVMFEVGFWIGPTPGVAPSAGLRARYSDLQHTSPHDRWVVFHFHVPLDGDTFMTGESDWYLGIASFGVFHSHDVLRPPRVDRTIRLQDFRAEYRYSNTYANGQHNTGALQNYNERALPFSCNRRRDRTNQSRWYLGYNYAGSIRELRNRGRPYDLANLINTFGRDLHQMGIFSQANLQRIWPRLQGSPPSTSAGNLGQTWYAPVSGAFDLNWLPNGNTPLDLSQADP
ncbi:glycoside hydrolase superfamily [Fusarium napiforme]|uniref:chitinase n=1 Tax=Fusarium napiforme TaxID=42672 RepID=A0A8H5JWM5_9HYPO|nr:glycoside hydrolase superfamily [Fusarium napiforme]